MFELVARVTNRLVVLSWGGWLQCMLCTKGCVRARPVTGYTVPPPAMCRHAPLYRSSVLYSLAPASGLSLTTAECRGIAHIFHGLSRPDVGLWVTSVTNLISYLLHVGEVVFFAVGFTLNFIKVLCDIFWSWQTPHHNCFPLSVILSCFN